MSLQFDNQANTITATEIRTGDLVLARQTEEGAASWRIIEYPDRLEAINERTGARYRIALIPVEEMSS